MSFPDQIRRWTDASPRPNIVACFECGRRSEVPEDAVALFCPWCNAPIEIAPYDVAGLQTHVIRTRGPVIIQTRARYDGPKLVAGRLEIHGVLASEYACEDLILGRLAKLEKPGSQRRVHVMPGGRVEVEFPMEVVEACIGGVLEVPSLDVMGTLYIPRGGAVIARHVGAGGLVLEKGGRLECELDVSPRKRPEEPRADPLPILVVAQPEVGESVGLNPTNP
ncbi:MAG TPA: hypothetical protein PLU30_22335 [Verrucomicrobiae bacterium]|nr:hypothetical protein [Verrucomicrobiae bacterium]